MHYQRWQRHSDPAVRLSTVGRRRAQRFFREVVLSYEGDECLTWPFARNKFGYGVILSEGRKQIVSRLVCTEVNGPPPTEIHEAAHLCGKGHEACVARRHLAWKTPVANAADRLVHGTDNRGSRNGLVRLTEDDVRQIRAMRGTASMSAIGRQFDVSAKSISQIYAGDSWKWLE